MKKYLMVPLLFTILLLSGCGLVQMAAIPGNSIADTRLKIDIIKGINNVLPLASGCTQGIGFSNIKSHDVTIPYNGKYWQEAWTVTACGQDHVFLINFYNTPQGGTVYKMRLKEAK